MDIDTEAYMAGRSAHAEPARYDANEDRPLPDYCGLARLFDAPSLRRWIEKYCDGYISAAKEAGDKSFNDPRPLPEFDERMKAALKSENDRRRAERAANKRHSPMKKVINKFRHLLERGEWQNSATGKPLPKIKAAQWYYDDYLSPEEQNLFKSRDAAIERLRRTKV